MAAEFGAALATDEAETIELFGAFGFNALTYVQLIDDLRDACPYDIQNGDLARRKKTVPVVFFHHYLVQSFPGTVGDQIWQNLATDLPQIRLNYEISGAEDFCAVIAEVFLNRARSNLLDLRTRIGEVSGLEEYLESLVHGSEQFTAAS